MRLLQAMNEIHIEKLRGTLAMKLTFPTMLMLVATVQKVQAQSEFEVPLCEAAKSNRFVELVYDKDVRNRCEPRLVVVHQLAICNDGKLYMHQRVPKMQIG